MSVERFKKLEGIFNAALERERSERESYLDEACGGDPSLREEVEALLETHDSGEIRFMESLPSGSLEPSLLAGEGRLGEYELLEEIARGGMGVVYKARQLSVNRIVALKAILGGQLASAGEVERFRREANAVAALDHPHVVPVYDVSEEEGVHCFAMKLMAGGSLAQPEVSLDRNPRTTAALLQKIARAVHHAHQRGILHRDLKPANILLDGDGEPHVSDFGLAKPLEDDKRLTLSGQVLGTASYMAPEQASGLKGAVTVASDVYSLGAILYELLTTRPPFEGQSSVETLRKVLEEEPARPRSGNETVPIDLESICLKCLEKNPDKRYSSAEALAADLRRFLDGESVEARTITSVGRGWRWCCRHPAATTIGVLALVIALGSSIATLWLMDERRRTHENLWTSLLAQAEKGVLSPNVGQRVDGLLAVRKAAKIRADIQLRNAAAACLSLCDLEVEREWQGCPLGTEWLVFDSEMKRYARGDSKGNVSVRSVADDRELAHLQLEGNAAWVSGFSPDDRLLAVRHGTPSDRGADLWIWDWHEGTPLFKAPLAQWGAAEFSPDGRKFAYGSTRGTVHIHEIASGKEVFHQTAGRACSDVQFSPDGTTLSAGTDNVVKFWNLETKKQTGMLPVANNVGAHCWHPSGSLLAVSWGSVVDIYDVQDVSHARHLRRIREASGGSVAFSHAGDMLATSDYDHSLRLWNLAGDELIRVEGRGFWPQFSKDDHLVGAYRLENTVGIWSLTTSRVLRTIGSRTTACEEISVHQDGRWVLTSGWKGVELCDLAGGQEISSVPAAVAKIAVFHSSSGIISGTDYRGTFLSPFVLETSRDVLRVGPPRKLHDAFSHVTLSAEGRYLAMIDTRPPAHIVVLDLEDSARVVATFQHGNTNWRAVSPHGAWLASGPLHGEDVKVWDVRSGEEVWRLPAPVSVLSARVLFSPDGEKLVISTQTEISVWKVASWEREYRLHRKSLREIPSPIALSGDGRILAWQKSARLVELIDMETRRELVSLQVRNATPLADLQFSADGSVLVGGRLSEGIYVWRLRELRRELRQMGLDWDAPPYPPVKYPPSARPPRVELDVGK